MMVAWMALAMALAEGPADVRTDVADGVRINWTRQSLEVDRSARGSGTRVFPPSVETQVRVAVQTAIEDFVGRVPVTSASSIASLLSNPRIASAVSVGQNRWGVVETRYYASGRVELLAELPLIEVTRVWSIDRAVDVPDARPPVDVTGVVLDARGLDLTPVLAPRIRADDGEVIYEGVLWSNRAVDTVPVVYVTDPAHPASARAGTSPLFLRAVSVSGSDLYLSPEASTAARALGEGDPWRQGAVVIVVEDR